MAKVEVGTGLGDVHFKESGLVPLSGYTQQPSCSNSVVQQIQGMYYSLSLQPHALISVEAKSIYKGQKGLQEFLSLAA